MSTAELDPISRACRLLREGAAELKNCHTPAATDHDWTGEPEAKAVYDEHMATADALERWADSIGAGGVESLRGRQCLHQIAEPAGEYPALPEQVAWRDSVEHCDLYWRPAVQEHNDLEPLFTDKQMRAYVDADRAMRAACAAPAAVAGPVVNRATVIEWLDANDIEVTDRQMDGLFHFAAPTTQPAHPDDAAVDALAAHMKAKLAKQRAKGYGGWDDPGVSQQRLSDMLRDHVAKGDPVDVANFCAFLTARGEGIAPPAHQQEAQEPVMIYHGGCTIDCGEHGHHNVELLRMIPAGSKLYTAPQPSPAPQGNTQIAPADVLLRTAIAETLYQQVRIEHDNRIGPWSAFDVREQQRIVDSIQGLCSVFAPASQGNELDAARLDWLDKNIFYRDMPEWDAKYVHGSAYYNMWVLFAPKVAQGSARKIIDAACAAQEGKSHG